MSEQKQKKNRAALGLVITIAIAVAIEGARHFPGRVARYNLVGLTSGA